MYSCLILCRSLTYAQRTAKTLERYGIIGRIVRTPREITAEGCGHSVKISEKSLGSALEILKKDGLQPKHVYRVESSGYSEVAV